MGRVTGTCNVMYDSVQPSAVRYHILSSVRIEDESLMKFDMDTEKWWDTVQITV